MGDPQQLLDGHESRGRVRPATALELRHALLQDVADARQRAVDAHQGCPELLRGGGACRDPQRRAADRREVMRSEEHTSELQSRLHLVCRLLLEKKKKTQTRY